MNIVRMRRLALVLMGLIVMTPFQNCGTPMYSYSNQGSSTNASGSSSNGLGGQTLQVDQALQTQSLAILSNRCGACHVATVSGGVGQLTDVNHLISSGLITVGNPTQSTLITAITSGGMPLGGSIPSTELQTLENWISSMSLVGSVSGGTSGGGGIVGTGPLPAGKTVAVDSTLHTQAMQIINISCAGCHQTITNGGVTNILDVKNLVTTGLITVGDPTKGRLIAAISAGTMPAGGAMVSAADLQTLKNWISSMSIVDDTGQAALPTRAALSATFTGVYANVIQPKCLPCHNSSYGVSPYFNSYTSVKNNTGDILSKVNSGEMPRAPFPTLTGDELTALQTWIGNGAPQN